MTSNTKIPSPEEYRDKLLEILEKCGRTLQEFEANLERLVSIPGQQELAMILASDHTLPLIDGPLSVIELDTLRKSAKPLPSDWESKPSLNDLDHEVSMSYVSLTMRGLVKWSLTQGQCMKWLTCETTDAGNIEVEFQNNY